MVVHMTQLTTVILAAGEAKRMRSSPAQGPPQPLRAAPHRLSRQCCPGARSRVVVVVGRAADEVRAAVSPEAGAGFVEQKERLGTGHAVLQARVRLR